MNAQTPVKAQHVMKILDHTGHTMVTWDPADTESVAAARAKFRELRSSGHSAFRMDIVAENGVLVEDQGELIREFDPELGHIMMVPQRQGG